MKTRSTVEHNAMELIIPMVLVFSCIHTYDDLHKEIEKMKNDKSYYESKIKFNILEDFEEYVKDIEKKKKFIVEKKYIENFREQQKLYPIFNTENIEYILVSGKKNKHAEIEELNKDVVDKKECKADIYIKQKTGEVIGFSIKQQYNSTKTNFSVEKILSNINTEYSVLTSIRKKYLNDNGFTRFNKTERELVNRLFYPQSEPNPYWSEIRKYIHDNNDAVIQKIIEPLFCKNIKNYYTYEFDGQTILKLKRDISSSKVSFEEYNPYYLCKTGKNETEKKRETAKMFYRLVVDDDVYRVEVRWKGNIFASSPQFQVHKDNDPKNHPNYSKVIITNKIRIIRVKKRKEISFIK
jgi:hypothetical protein